MMGHYVETGHRTFSLGSEVMGFTPKQQEAYRVRVEHDIELEKRLQLVSDRLDHAVEGVEWAIEHARTYDGQTRELKRIIGALALAKDQLLQELESLTDYLEDAAPADEP